MNEDVNKMDDLLQQGSQLLQADREQEEVVQPIQRVGSSHPQFRQLDTRIEDHG